MNKCSLFAKGLFITRKTRKFVKKNKYDQTRYSLQYRNDYLVHKITKAFKSLKIQVDVIGYENVPNSGPALIVANHQDNIDPLVLIYALKKQTEDKNENNKIATFIAKDSLQYKASTRYPLMSINTFFLNRKNLKKSLETYNNFGKFIKENKTFGAVFPEGTRNKDGVVGEFKPGALKIAKKELLPIIPVTINNSVQGLNIHRKTPLKIEVIFHKKINPISFVNQNTIALAKRVQDIIESNFKKPEFSFIEKENVNEETSKAAIKWHKKERKIEEKAAKKERKEREHERKIIEAQERENKKYEKYIEKKERKSNNKN